MAKITKEQYEFALARIEELLPVVDDNTPSNDRNAVELTMMSDHPQYSDRRWQCWCGRHRRRASAR